VGFFSNNQDRDIVDNDIAAPSPSAALLKMGGEVRNALSALRESTEMKNQATLRQVTDGEIYIEPITPPA
jgi:hypothetical protein